MDLQYISDSNGKHTAVIIPIDEWNNITTKHQDLKTLDKPKKKPSDFVGCISKETADKLNEYVKQSREEWERDIF